LTSHGICHSTPFASHRCATKKTAKPASTIEEVGAIDSAIATRESSPAVAADITNAITNAEPVKLTRAERAAAWNKAHREAYNARQRKLMKERRAAAKTKRAATAG